MTQETLEKTYDPHAIEQKLYAHWESQGYFAPAAQGDSAYCIMIPPPNVTGVLHMGHAFQDTLMDALIRYHRMCGETTLWQAGTDHAGIATQMVVERQLKDENKTRHDLGREAFLERVWKWKGESGGSITRQLRRMGASLDWSRERFTMDDGLSEAVKEVFVRLHQEGLIYRGKRLVNWDPVLHTAVSDLEVLSEEESGHMWHMRYPLTDGSGYMVVATTRPETMLGDAAVAVHPDDKRYQKLIGKTVKLPLTKREIPVIADEYVDPEFGSGCVKITPAHDFNDYEVWQRHKDESGFTSQPQGGLINIFTIDAKIKSSVFDEFTWSNRAKRKKGTQIADGDGLAGSAATEIIPKKYQGLDRYEARDVIVHDLKELDLLEKIEDHKLMVPRGDRSGVVVEPFLTDQWYVKVAPLAEPAIKAVENGDIKFVPENWSKTYFEWMNNIQDWCISRQIWWGHRIPAWYDDDGNVYVGRDEAEVRSTHKLGDIPLRQDEDVLDTWFSSALWPFSTLGWPAQTPELKTFYPTSVLVTGFDIIFFWVARMIMMGLKFMGDVPFREVYIHGLVRDAHGQKMSKSKGNVLDPIDLIDGIDLEALVKKRTTGLMQPQMAPKIEKATRKDYASGIPAFGTDALRFTFAALASTGRDINFDMGRIEGYRNFCNKLWNAARYVLMNTEDKDCGQTDGNVELSAADRWIISRLQEVESHAQASLKNYRFDHMAQTVYAFVWDEYCSWYLELSKVVLTSPDSSEQALRGTRRTLVRVLETLLRLLHPFIPFITEEIWQKVAPLAAATGDTIMLQPYPQPQAEKIDQAAMKEIQWLMDFVTGVRNIRGEMDIKPSQTIPVLLQDATDQDQRYLASNQGHLKTLAKIDSIKTLSPGDEAPESATALVGNMKVLLPLAGLIDKTAELKRLGKEIERYRKEIEKAKTKLANKNFVDKAPQEVVTQEQGRLQDFQMALQNMETQYDKVQALPD